MDSIHLKQSSFYDIVIIGGGPAGLAFAAALNGTGLKICLIEKQTEQALKNPVYDGRDIALTHDSIDILHELGIFQCISPQDISPIKQAHVMNGTSPYILNFNCRDQSAEALGYLVSNHMIRAAAHAAVQKQENLEIRYGIGVESINQGSIVHTLTFSDKTQITTSLVVAADSRFSNTRRMMGIPVAIQDFGRSIIVGRVKHQRPHNNIACEYFHYERTLAILPLNGNMSSVVITLRSDQVESFNTLDDDTLAIDLARRLGYRLGAMELTSKRFVYPLIATYAARFYASRFVLLGDAAVGMHPVTAHGYNFGLYGVRSLASLIRKASRFGLDIGAPKLLNQYNQMHRDTTFTLYHSTNAIAKFFTNEHLTAKFGRAAILRLCNLVTPIKTIITRQLTQKQPSTKESILLS